MSNEKANKRTKHLYNTIETAVKESAYGLALTHEHIQMLKDQEIVVFKHRNPKHVAVIGGGGSGHEPYAGGYVGDGMFTGGVAGQIFASPRSGLVYELIALLCKEQAAAGSNAGVLVIGINYTGDRLTFGAAVEEAKTYGYNCEALFTADDAAFYGKEKKTGRRGLAGALFLAKVAGAMSRQGKNLKEIKSYIDQMNAELRTMSTSLTPCNVPGRGLSFELKDDEMEVGLGIHGEAGVSRQKLIPAGKIAKQMVDTVLGDTGIKRAAVIVNDLGGLSNFEHTLIAGQLLNCLKEKQVKVERVYLGAVMTSFSMHGVSITLLPVKDDKLLKYLDEPCTAPAWPSKNIEKCVLNPEPILDVDTKTKDAKLPDIEAIKSVIGESNEKVFIDCVKAATERLVKAEKELNDLDMGAGDGDCGSSLKEGAQHILDAANKGELQASFSQLADLVKASMGGTSGGIYGLLFRGCSQKFQDIAKQVGGGGSQSKSQASVSKSRASAASASAASVADSAYHLPNGRLKLMKIWRETIEHGLNTVMKYSGAQPGDRTMIDSLHGLLQGMKQISSSEELKKETLPQTLDRIANSVKEAAEATAKMEAKAGRAAYVNEKLVVNPDPGAIAVSMWIKAVTDKIKEWIGKCICPE